MSDWVGKGIAIPPSPGGLTIIQMVDIVKVYLNGRKGKNYKPQFITQLINMGQDKTVLLLNKHILNQINVVEVDLEMDANGEYDLDELSYTIFGNNNAIDGLKRKGGDFFTKISLEEYRKAKDINRVFSENDQVYRYYGNGNKIRFEPYANGRKFEIHYRREPLLMVYSDDEDENIDCEFNFSIQKIILGMALEDYIDDNPKAARVFNGALASIEKLNSEYHSSESAKMGKFVNRMNWGGGYFDILKGEVV